MPGRADGAEWFGAGRKMDRPGGRHRVVVGPAGVQQTAARREHLQLRVAVLGAVTRRRVANLEGRVDGAGRALGVEDVDLELSGHARNWWGRGGIRGRGRGRSGRRGHNRCRGHRDRSRRSARHRRRRRPAGGEQACGHEQHRRNQHPSHRDAGYLQTALDARQGRLGMSWSACSTGAKRSPVAATRAAMVAMFQRSGRRSGSSSSVHSMGVDTGAPGAGRSE